jgi:hypothetical protein
MSDRLSGFRVAAQPIAANTDSILNEHSIN